jgi:hypothetical protein
MSDYFSIGPCDQKQLGYIPPFTLNDVSTLMDKVVQQNNKFILDVVTPIFNDFVVSLKEDNTVLKRIVNVVTKTIKTSSEQQEMMLGKVILDIDTVLKNDIAEQEVQLRYISSLVDLDQEILKKIEQGPPLRGDLPPAVVNVTEGPVNVVVQEGKPTPPQPPVQLPPQIIEVPGPVQIKVVQIPVYVPCAPEKGVTVNVNDPVTVGSVFDSSTVDVGPISLKSDSTSIGPAITEDSDAGRGGGGGQGSEKPIHEIPYPVDLDQPLAFIFSPDDNKWKRRAIAFYGDGLSTILGESTLDGINAALAAAEMAQLGDVWGVSGGT